MKVLHIINWLHRSGAEMAMTRLALAQQAFGDDVAVIALLPGGVLEHDLTAAGISVTTLNLKPNAALLPQGIALARAVRAANPDVIHTWLYHANLIGGTVARVVTPRTPIVWGIHHSYLKAESSKWTTRLVSRGLAVLSRVVPTRIAYCADASRRAHEDAGYDRRRGMVIPNGVDDSMFQPNAEARRDVRRELGIEDDAFVIGTVARWHPDKDIPTLVRAMAIVARARDDARLMLVGGGLDTANPDLARVIDASAAAATTIAVGPRADIDRVLNAYDVFALTSITDAFPVSIIEAMASGVPCVATDVGDARTMIGSSGRVVAVGDAEAMAAAILDLHDLAPILREALARAARQRIVDRYRLEDIVAQHRTLYADLIAAN